MLVADHARVEGWGRWGVVLIIKVDIAERTGEKRIQDNAMTRVNSEDVHACALMMEIIFAVDNVAWLRLFIRTAKN